MANIYVRSTDGSDADNGSTWALAKATLTGAAAIDAAGDTIYISQAHAESTAAAITFSLAGSLASPTKIICGSDSAEPPTAISSAGAISTTGASSITFAGTAYSVYGLILNCGNGGTGADLILQSSTNAVVEFVGCKLNLTATGSGRRIRSGADASQITLTDCNVSFSSTGQFLSNSNNVYFVWNGGGITSGSSAITQLFGAGSTAKLSSNILSGLDLSAGAAGMNIFSAQSGAKNSIRNCKLPASWSGSLVSGTLSIAERHEMYNCDSGDTNIAIRISDYAGSMIQEETVVRTGGASNGTATISWKMVSSASAEYPLLTFDAPEIVRWNDTTGSAITATVEVVTDGVTLTDGECWLEVQYLGTSGFPLGSFVTDAKADVLATAANQTTSTETWTTTGLASPTKQKLSVTFTPQEKGFIHAVVKLAKASTTVYVDPLLTIT